MNNKIGSILLLLSCIFISLGFGLLFQNKIVLEGVTYRRSKKDKKDKKDNKDNKDNKDKFPIPRTITTPTSALTAAVLTPTPASSTPIPEVLTTDYIMNTFKSSIDTQIKADKKKQSNNDYSDALTELKAIMKKIKPKPNDEISMKDYNTIIIECINYIIGLDLRFEDNRKYRLTYIKNFIILPNEPIAQAPEIIKQLDSIVMQTNKKNWEKIKEIKAFVKTFAQK